MSAKISELLEVMDRVRGWHGSNQNYEISVLRRKACKLVAGKRGIKVQTVTDKIIRKLRPDISQVATFDRLMEAWLNNADQKLKSVLIKHSDKGFIDGFSVEEFFAGKPN